MCKNKEEFNQLVEEYRRLSAQIKKADAHLSSVKADMEAYIKAKGKPKEEGSTTLVVYGDGYKVSLIIIDSPVLDKAKITEYFGDKISDFQKPNVYPRIDVR